MTDQPNDGIHTARSNIVEIRKSSGMTQRYMIARDRETKLSAIEFLRKVADEIEQGTESCERVMVILDLVEGSTLNLQICSLGTDDDDLLMVTRAKHALLTKEL